MKKIVFMMPFYMLPLPSTMGGGVEELMTLLLNEHEKQENVNPLFQILPLFTGVG